MIDDYFRRNKTKKAIKNIYTLLLQVKTPRKSGVLGLVDLYGFAPNAGNNGFQQLAINYANEKLHQATLGWTLREEQQELQAEGLEWSGVAFEDNSEVCAAIDRAVTGVLSLLDEVSLRRAHNGDVLSSVSSSSEGEGGGGQSSAELLLDKMEERLSQHPRVLLRVSSDGELDEEERLPRHCFRYKS